MAVFDFLNPMKNVTPRYTEEQLEQIVEWFDENAKPVLEVNNQVEEPEYAVTIEQLEQFLGILFMEQKNSFHRRNFHYPTYNELMTEVELLKMETVRLLNKDQVIYLFDKWIVEPDIKHELKLAFKVFDPEMRNFIEIDILSDKITTLGDVFSPEEIIEFTRDANMTGDGNIRYEDFVESMFNLAPELYNLEREFLYENPDEDPSVPPMPPSEAVPSGIELPGANLSGTIPPDAVPSGTAVPSDLKPSGIILPDRVPSGAEPQDKVLSNTVPSKIVPSQSAVPISAPQSAPTSQAKIAGSRNKLVEEEEKGAKKRLKQKGSKKKKRSQKKK